jgi:hypothetical protein
MTRTRGRLRLAVAGAVVLTALTTATAAAAPAPSSLTPGFLQDPRGLYRTFRFPGARSTGAQKINDRGQITGTYNNPNAAPTP